MDMKNRVRLELRNRSPAEVLELILDNCRSTDGEIEGLTNEFSELEYLSLVNVGLGSLAKVPSLPKLRKVSHWPGWSHHSCSEVSPPQQGSTSAVFCPSVGPELQ
uniref:Acidic leucine-rich nuclear phosphoprotein 32 family member n=1 Tax=Takifugu rubripes TaxID=31033 RepID=H2SDG3_TAKRU